MTASSAPLTYTQWRIQKTLWYLDYYGYVVGLDNRWEMFSYSHKFVWNLNFIGKRGTEHSLLSLPRQSDRTFLQYWLWDFKEGKFHLNMYGSPAARAAYGAYLCNHFKDAVGKPFDAIEVSLKSQNILPREEAYERGTHLDPTANTRKWETIPCSNG